MAQLWTAYFNINNDPEYAEMFNFPEATITLDEFNSDLRFPRE